MTSWNGAGYAVKEEAPKYSYNSANASAQNGAISPTNLATEVQLRVNNRKEQHSHETVIKVKKKK